MSLLNFTDFAKPVGIEKGVTFDREKFAFDTSSFSIVDDEDSSGDLKLMYVISYIL
jgi:hypothetical protein